MGLILLNALLAELDPPAVEAGSLRIEDGKIAARGPMIERAPGDTVIDCAGAVVLPGLVNGHTHLYSALAAGMPAPRETPRNFHEILKFVWWRLDRALDEESIELSARIGAMDALRCGTTTLIDHHASPNVIGGSLDLIEQGLATVGLRGVLCYETTDRNGINGREAGVEENRRYLAKCAKKGNGQFAGLAGAHASFTCDDATLDDVAALASQFDTGVHLHVAEDPVDERLCREQHGIALIDRLERHGILRPGTIIAHGTHLGSEALGRLREWNVWLAHNTRSNMNNAVGYTPVDKVNCPILLGTDGIGANMFSEAQTAWFKSRDGGAAITPQDVLMMLANNARRASEALGVTLGRLSPGAVADIVVTNYLPATPLTGDNLAAHLIFAMGSQHVRHVYVGGKLLLENGVIVSTDEADGRSAATEAARRLWERMAALD